MTNQELWMKITHAQAMKMHEITHKDSDGKDMKIILAQSGWYEGYY